MGYLIGVDIGTSGTKTVIFDEKGATMASATVEYPLYQPKNGWAEQEPIDWWNATVETIRRTLQISGIKPEDISGIGLSGQMHGAVFLDRNGAVLRKSIIWCDQRTAKECDEITQLVTRERLLEITANPALSGFTSAKILWVKNNEPEIFAKTAKILLPKDYIRYMLTGEYASEVSDASGMQLLDVRNRCWSPEVCSKLGIDMSLLGKMYESPEITGTVTAKAADVTGLKIGTPVVGGAGDQAAGAIGNGIVRSGIISSTIGTSGVVFAHSDTIAIDKKGRVHTFCHAVPGCWHVMGVTQGAGLSFRWFRDNFCGEEMRVAEQLETDAYDLMTNEAMTVPAGANGLIYLPYLMGERTPHLDPNCRGVYFGLSAMHGKKEMLRATMEGIVHSLLDCMNIIREMGIEATEVRASGGGGRSSLFRQMQADMFNTEIATVNSSEGPALGVALLAGVGSGVYKSVPEACSAAIQKKASQLPNKKDTDTYLRYHELYNKLYDSLKQDFVSLSNFY